MTMSEGTGPRNEERQCADNDGNHRFGYDEDPQSRYKHEEAAHDRRSASKCQGKWPDQTLDQVFGLPEVLVAVSTSRLSCKRASKTRTLMPVWDSSGESRPN